MNSIHVNRRKHAESGIALLIAIFVLLLISVVAISLIVSSGSESALAGNYRSSASAYFAGVGGLEEARGRLNAQNADYFNASSPGFIPATLALGQVRYITNPVGAENVLTAYPDTEYDKEFGQGALAAATVQTIASVSTVTSGGTTYQGPLFKWVRINPITEASIKIDVNNDGVKNTATVLYYDGAQLNLTSSGKQALEITSLAVLPNGTRKILQYVVAPTSAPPFPGAFTIAGNGQTQCQLQGTAPMISGIDHAPGAAPGSGMAGLALTSTTDYNQCKAGIDSGSSALVTGAAPYNSLPSVRDTSVTNPPLDPSLNPSIGLNSFVNSLIQQANQTISGDIPNGANLGTCNGSVNNPLITVVNSPTQMGPITGCGILIVQSSQAQLQIDGNIQWNGVIMLIATSGQAQFQMQSGTGSINGAFYMGAVNGAQLQMQMQQGPSGGINYDSRWINNAFPGPLQTLSFHEIQQ